ncbi:MAG: 5-(carboxyamino)imidazole ribonucleotide mutase [Candidatus Aminicenantes bacterium]
MKVVIVIGSASDFDVVKGSLGMLKKFGVSFVLEVSSAHRTPERTVRLVKQWERDGAEIFISVAGKAAHLGGVIAAHTSKPVIGVPVGSATLNGMDALLSTVQMPRGVPVACMGVGESGAVNAALLAVQILALQDGRLADQLKKFRLDMAAEVEKSSEEVKAKI